MKNRLYSLCFLLLAIVLLGCPNTVLPTPNYATSAENSVSFSESAYWGAPANFTASNGYQGRIELSWSSVKSAHRYYVYESSSATSGVWTQCGETDASTTSFTISDCGAGADMYYRVTAVKKNGTESATSRTVRGTSLARPVITDIDEGDENDSMSVVSWWVNNVEEETYLNEVVYTVYCLDASEKEVASITTSKGTTKATFTGLTANTSYYYYVEAYHNRYQTEIEVSDTVDAETARRLIPDAVTELSVSQGVTPLETTTTLAPTTGIKVSFTTPKKCDVLDKETQEYKETDLYFKIYRRAKGDTKWTSIGDFLPYTSYTDSSTEKFIVGTSDTRSSLQTFAASTENETKGKETDEGYQEGVHVTYIDTSSLKQNVQYEYYVQSYVFDKTKDDYTKDPVSSDTSSVSTVATGWLISKANVTLATNEDIFACMKTLSTEEASSYASDEVYVAAGTYTDNQGNSISIQEGLQKKAVFTKDGKSYEGFIYESATYPVIYNLIHEQIDENIYEAIAVAGTRLQCKFTYETFDLDSQYKFVVKQTFYQAYQDGETTKYGGIKEGNSYTENTPMYVIYRTFDSLKQLNDTEYTIPAGKTYVNETEFDWRGKYAFEGFVVGANYEVNDDGSAASMTGVAGDSLLGPDTTVSESDISDYNSTNYYTKATLNTTIIVSDSIDKPDLTNCSWSVKNGYKDKLVFSWTYNEAYTYSIYDADNKVEIVDAVAMDNGISSHTNGETVTYTLSDLESGHKANYQLCALKGFTVYSESIEGKTLGTAKPSFDKSELDYTTVTVTWSDVQEATSYIVKAEYTDTISDVTTPTEVTTSKLTIDKTGEKPVYKEGDNETTTFRIEDGDLKYTIKIPAVSDSGIDSQWAGKNVKISVTAQSTITETESDSTVGNVTAWSLGPANTNVTATTTTLSQKDRIYVTWKATEGAKGYWVSREKLNFDGTLITENAVSDGYYVSVDGKIVKAGGSTDVSSLVTVTLSGTTYTLSDRYQEVGGSEDTWNKNQDLIAWGYPFSYAVFPVKSADDSLELITENISDDTHGNGELANVKWTNVKSVSKQGNALGYGREVTASKSTDPRSVTISFTAPKNQGNATPTLKYREAGSTGSWTSSSAILADGKFVVQLTGDDRTKAFEYAVDYSGRSSLLASYVDALASTKSDVECKSSCSGAISDSSTYYEPLNKGYAFAIKVEMGHSGAGTSAGTSEYIALTPWDYNTRAVGPDTDYTFQIKNPNLSSSYKDIVTLDKSSYELSNNDNNSATYKVTATAGTGGGQGRVTFAPDYTKEATTYNTNNVHTGILEVLRDYRHYGKVEAKRTFTVTEENDTTITASYNDVDENNIEKEISTYRGLTDAEFARCIGLIVGDAILQCGVSSGGNSDVIKGQTGQFITKHSNNTRTFNYGTDSTNYKHIFTGGRCSTDKSSFVSPFTINIENVSSRAAVDGTYLYYVPSSTITVTSDVNDVSYVGTAKFEAGDMGSTGLTEIGSTASAFGQQLGDGYQLKYVFSLTGRNKTISITTQSEATFEYWAPIDLGKSYRNAVTAYTSGKAVYTSPFWH